MDTNVNTRDRTSFNGGAAPASLCFTTMLNVPSIADANDK